MPSSAAVEPPITPSMAWRWLSEADDLWVEMPPPPTVVTEEQTPSGRPDHFVHPGKFSKENSSPSPEREPSKTCKSAERKPSTPSISSPVTPKSSSPPLSSPEKGEFTLPRRRKKYRTSPSPDRRRRNARSPSRARTRQTDYVAKEKNTVPAVDRETKLTTVCSGCGRQSPVTYNQHHRDVQEPSEVLHRQRARPPQSKTKEATTVSGVCPECGRCPLSHPHTECVRLPQSSGGSRPCKQQECSVMTKSELTETKEFPYLQQNSSEFTRESRSQQPRSHSPATLCNQCRKLLASHAEECPEKSPDARSLQSPKAVNHRGDDGQTKPQKPPWIPNQKAISPEMAFESKTTHASHMTKEMIYDLLSTPYEPLCMAYYAHIPRDRSTLSDASTPQQQSENNATTDFLRGLQESDQESQRQFTRSLEHTQEDRHSSQSSWPSDVRYWPQKLVTDTTQNIYAKEPVPVTERYCMPTTTCQNPLSQSQQTDIFLNQSNRRDFVQRPADAKTNTWFPTATYDFTSPTGDEVHHSQQPIHDNSPHHKRVFSPQLLSKDRANELAGRIFSDSRGERNGQYSFFPSLSSSRTRAQRGSRATSAVSSQPSTPPIGQLWDDQAAPQVDDSATSLFPIPPPMLVGASPVKLNVGLGRYASPPVDFWLHFSSSSPTDSSDVSSLPEQLWDDSQFVLPM